MMKENDITFKIRGAIYKRCITHWDQDYLNPYMRQLYVISYGKRV